MNESRTISVEVVYAKASEQLVLSVDVPQGTSAREAVELSGMLQHFPEIDLDTQKLGVYGKVVAADSPLQPQDRVEIYRPLIADPKQSKKRKSTETAQKTTQ